MTARIGKYAAWAAAVFAIVYTVLVSVAYITQLATVVPGILEGRANEVEPFLMTAGKFITAVDGLEDK